LNIFKAKPPSVGRIFLRRSLRAWVEYFLGEAPERGSNIFKVKPLSVGQIFLRRSPRAWVNVSMNSRCEELYFIDWCRRHNVERGLLPTPSYREREGKESLSLLRIEAAQLHGVPRVILIQPCFVVA
jgi:hypothetical protein